MLKKIFSASIIYAIAPQLPKIVSLFMMPIITKYMTPQDYGISGIIMAYMAAFDAFKDLGLNVVLTSSFFKYPKKYRFIWSKIHGVIQLWSILYGMLLAILLYFIIPISAKENYIQIACFILIPIMFFDSVISIGRMYFQLNKLPIRISIVSVISGLITILFNYLFIVIYQLGYLGLLIGMFASGVFNFLVYVYFVYFSIRILPSFKFNWKWVKSKFKISLPTIPHFYAGYLLNISDRVFMDLFKLPIKEIGLYSFAYSIGTYFSIIGKSYFQASGPYYMEFNKENSKNGDLKSKNISYVMQIILIGLAFLLSIWMKEVFQLLVKNKELSTTYVIAILIVFSYCYFPSYAYNSMKIWYSEKTKLLLKISVIAALISVLLNLILLPIIGYLGAAISTFVSFLYMGYGGYLYKDINSLSKVKYQWYLWPILTLILLFSSLILVEFNIFLKLCISIALLLIAFIVAIKNKTKLLQYIK